MLSFVKKILFILSLCGTLVAGAESKKWIFSFSNVSANLAPSQYIVSSITGSSQVLETEPDLGFPVSKLYTFKLCLSHPNNKTPFKGANLSIDGSSVPLKPQILDDSCLSWTENINYHYTAPARFVTLLRTLNINRSPIGDTIPFQFAINPWLHGESSSNSEIADFIKIKPRNPVPASKAQAALSGRDPQSKEVPILANDARVNFQELGLDSKLGGHFLFDFRATPQIELYNAAGQPVYLKLAQGEFEFEAYLISTLFEGDAQVRRIVNPQPLKGVAHLRDGALAYLQEITLPAIPSRGRLELAIVLRPKQNKPYLRVLKAIYILGDYTDLKSNLYARLKPGFTNGSQNFNFEEYVGTDKEKSMTFGESQRDGIRRLKYEFEPLLFKLTRVGDETATSRQVYYQVRACVRNGTDNTPLRGYHFSITKAQTDPATPTGFAATIRPSEYDSCIYWDDRIDHKFYAPQKYYRADYHIENKELNLDETLSAYINPWDIILSRDARTIEPAEVERENQTGKHQAQIFIPSYKIQTRTIQYSLDELLRLQIQKQVHLLIEPMILNYSHITKGIDSRDPIRDGIWKIRWAILHNRYESPNNPFMVLARGEQLTLATQGRIVSPINISFNDFRYVDSRNYFMLEISPVKPDSVVMEDGAGLVPKDPNRDFSTTIDWESGLSPQTFIGPLIAGPDEEVGYLIPHPQNQLLSAFVEQNNLSQMASSSENFIFEKSAPTWENIPATKLMSPSINKDTLKQWINNRYLAPNNIQSWNLDEPAERISLRRHMGPSVNTVKKLSAKYQRSLFMTDMLVRALQRHELTAELEDRLCFYFFDQNPYRPVNFKSNLLPWRGSDFWLKKCLRSVGQPNSSFFKAQIETPVDSINEVQYVGSTSSGLTVGSSFSVSSSESMSESSSVSASTQAGLTLKLSELISVGGNTSYSLSRSENKGRSSGNGLSISTGVNLNVRKLTLNISGTHSQQCMTAEIDPGWYLGSESLLLHDVKKSVSSLSYAHQFLTQKVRLCFTDEVNKPFRIQENFYFITQDTSGAGFIDNPDIRNRPLLLQLRSTISYENFLRFIGAGLATPQQTKIIDDPAMSIDDRAIKALHMTVPSFPGVFIETLNR